MQAGQHGGQGGDHDGDAQDISELDQAQSGYRREQLTAHPGRLPRRSSPYRLHSAGRPGLALLISGPGEQDGGGRAGPEGCAGQDSNLRTRLGGRCSIP